MKEKSTSVKQKPTKTALQRISDVLDAGEKNGMPKDAAMITALSLEIQVLENRIERLEKSILELQLAE